MRTAREFRAARAAGEHAAFIGIQGGNALDDGIDALDLIADGSVLRVTLLHLTSSRLGASSAPGSSRAAGLTDFGRAYVERLNELRVGVDLAHVSRKGFFDAVEVHDKTQPLFVTHTGLAGVYEHWRNITDEQLRVVADTGGTVGVMLHASFLGRRGVTVGTVADHLAHIVDTVGEDHASIGTDYDGAITPPKDLPGLWALPRLVQEMLDRGWSERAHSEDPRRQRAAGDRGVARLAERAQASVMALLEQINADLKKAMLERDEVTRDTLRMIKSELLTLDNPDELAVLSRAVKSRRDSIKSYVEGGRQDLADKEQAEIEVIERYLPKQLGEDEAREAIAGIIEELGLSSKKELGKVMKELKARYPGQVDGRLASSIAGQLLG